MKKIAKLVFIIAFSISPIFVSSVKAAAMGMGMGPPTPCGGPFPPCPVPLDSSAWLLAAAGISLAVYSIYKMKKKNPA